MKSIWTYENLQNFKTFRITRPEVICKEGVPRNFAKLKGKHLCHGLSFNKVVFPCEFCEIYKSIFSYNTPPVAASEL